MNTIEQLDKVFSIYVRQRDCPTGVGRCLACGTIITPTTCDASHYINRRHLSTRWDEENVHACCVECNRYKSGNLEAFAIGIRNKLGNDTIVQLERKKQQVTKFSGRELREKIKYYKNKLLKTALITS
ncbi:MAG: recombination protein NinG [Bacteroidales bacterium]